MRPIFRDLSRNHPNIKFLSIDLDYARWMGEKFDIDSIPSFLFFKSGELKNKHVGFLEQDQFEEKIQEHLK
jgi:thioredoxin 1